jgi:hypothetical protein
MAVYLFSQGSIAIAAEKEQPSDHKEKKNPATGESKKPSPSSKPKQPEPSGFQKTLEEIKRTFTPQKGAHADLLKDGTVLDITEETRFNFCYTSSASLNLRRPQTQHDGNKLTLQKETGEPVTRRWLPEEQMFLWTAEVLPIEDGATYTLKIGGIDSTVTLHQLPPANHFPSDIEKVVWLADQRCVRQACLLVAPYLEKGDPAVVSATPEQRQTIISRCGTAK